MAQTAKPDGRDRALDTTISNLKKRFGDGAIMKLGEATTCEWRRSRPVPSRWTWRWALVGFRAGA